MLEHLKVKNNYFFESQSFTIIYCVNPYSNAQDVLHIAPKPIKYHEIGVKK